MATIVEIEKAERELERLEDEYISETPKCMNKKCGFWRDTNNKYSCSWTRKLEQCKDYKPEEEDSQNLT